MLRLEHAILVTTLDTNVLLVSFHRNCRDIFPLKEGMRKPTSILPIGDDLIAECLRMEMPKVNLTAG
jgi:hypothetical protein